MIMYKYVPLNLQGKLQTRLEKAPPGQVDYYPKQVTFKAMGKGPRMTNNKKLQLAVRQTRSSPQKCESCLPKRTSWNSPFFKPRPVDLLKN